MINFLRSKKFFTIGWVIIWIGLALLSGLFLAQSYMLNKGNKDLPKTSVANFWDCIDMGNPAMESYPRQCRHEEITFIEEIGNELEKLDFIQSDIPRPNQVVSSPLIIEGSAVGTWFFEGDFPVKLFDDSENLLAIGIATAESDWMTENFVRFRSEIEFLIPESRFGKLIFEKDNPSGLADGEDSMWMPVFFK